MTGDNIIILHTSDTIFFININDILYCKSDNSYTSIHISNHEPIVVSHKIKDFENQLSGFGFIRPHRSFLVNLAHIQKIDKKSGFTLILSGNKQIPTSTRKKKLLFHIFQKDIRFQTQMQHIQI